MPTKNTQLNQSAFVADVVIGCMTQRELADRHGISVSEVGKLIRGERRPLVRQLIDDSRASACLRTQQRLLRLHDRAVAVIDQAVNGNGPAAVAAAKWILQHSLPRFADGRREQPQVRLRNGQPWPPPDVLDGKPCYYWEDISEPLRRKIRDYFGVEDDADLPQFTKFSFPLMENNRPLWLEICKEMQAGMDRERAGGEPAMPVPADGPVPPPAETAAAEDQPAGGEAGADEWDDEQPVLGEQEEADEPDEQDEPEDDEDQQDEAAEPDAAEDEPEEAGKGPAEDRPAGTRAGGARRAGRSSPAGCGGRAGAGGGRPSGGRDSSRAGGAASGGGCAQRSRRGRTSLVALHKAVKLNRRR